MTTERWMRRHRARLPVLRFTFGWQARDVASWYVRHNGRRREDANGWDSRKAFVR